MPKLSAVFVKSAPPGKHEDGYGLRLIKRRDGGGQWVFRYSIHGRRREMVLGGTSAVSLKDARDMAAEYRALSKSATATKAADRLKIVLDHAAALGLDVDLQAVAKAKKLLGRQRHQVRSIPSMPWQEVPRFYASLEEPTITHLALRLLILTGLRSRPIRFARLDEIEGDIWTVPAEKMKARVGQASAFRVPLPKEALRVIDLAIRFERNGYLFPSARKGVISDATMSRHMERRSIEPRPHGFRTSLRTWLAECTNAPHEVAEAMLAHVADSKVVRTYRQTDFLDQRRFLLDEWSRFCTGEETQVIHQRQRGG